MIRRFPEPLKPGSWRTMSPVVYTALVGQLFRASGSIKYGEALLVGLLGGLGAMRAWDLPLAILTGLTALGILLLVPRSRRYAEMRLQERPAPEVRVVEHEFEVHSLLISLGIGLMAARGLLITGDVMAHMMMLLLVLGATSTNIRHHYRPHITAGKIVAILIPVAVALLLTGEPYYWGLAVVALLATKVFIDIALHLFGNAEAQLKVAQEKELLAKALNQRNREFRQREDQQREVEKALQRVQADLIHVSRINAMGTMASTLAHEINQPLAALSNYVHGSRRLIDKGGEKNIAAARDALLSAEETAERTAEIVRRIRSLVFRGEVETKPQELRTLIKGACEHTLSGTDTPGVQCHVDVERRAEWVNVDGVQIQQVLINLVRNAVEAMKGSDTRDVSIKAIATSSALVEISVADTGPGISEDMKAKLFSSFQTNKPEGMGMGLSISRTIVEAHGGQLWAENAPTGGAVFRMTLPRWKMVPAAASRA
ncbi:MAG TPA: ATP-binding protein [Allosphingosinicella sp.]|uniref:sensor histidine kinase n=1 Tax=Allosphingosinicella sp. TaxID=2823234 RepID=UPI002ED8D9B8